MYSSLLFFFLDFCKGVVFKSRDKFFGVENVRNNTFSTVSCLIHIAEFVGSFSAFYSAYFSSIFEPS